MSRGTCDVRRPLIARMTVLTAIAVMILGTIGAVRIGAFGAPPKAMAQQSGDQTITLSFVGDILLDYGVGDLISREGPMAPWESVKDILAASDFTMGNLECAVGTTGTPMPDKTYTFRADPTALEGLVGSGFDAVSLANNHTLDYGMDCFLETLDHVAASGIAVVGAGRNEAEARAPYIFEKNGISVGVLATNLVVPTTEWAATDTKPGQAFDWGGRRGSGICASVEALRQQVDIVVVMLHWGEERTTEPESWVKNMEIGLREAGADIIIGGHPHILRSIRYDGQTLTAHSMGNFVFTIRADIPACQESAILTVTVSKDGIESAEVYPTRIVNYRAIPLTGTDRDSAMNKLAALSRPFGSDIEISGEILPISFSDMVGHWARFTIARLTRGGVVQGYEDGTFRPNQNVTKAEFAALLARSLVAQETLDAAAAVEGFDLCPVDHWSYPYLKYLASVAAFPSSDPAWRHDTLCLRGDAMMAIWKAFGSQPVPEGFVTDFQDAANYEGESLTSALWGVLVGLLKGYDDNTLRLSGTLTRAEMSEVIFRLLDLSTL